jgi:uncharacterized pyridoxamine 5'-phosphate oxidase family protein
MNYFNLLINEWGEMMSVLLGTELNSTLKDLFDKRISTVIMATLDQSQRPHTAPFNYITVSDPKHLRVAISRNQQTFSNIQANGNVALAILEEGDVAVCIKGIARVIRNSMEFDYNMAVVEIEISEIKKDNSATHFVTQGIRIRHRNELYLLESRRIFQELALDW